MLMNFLLLFVATLAMLSPLFLAGIRRYTGQKARRALGANVISFCAHFVIATILGFGGSASAADLSVEAATASANVLAFGSSRSITTIACAPSVASPYATALPTPPAPTSATLPGGISPKAER